jgi:hypothetical protein
MTHEGPTCEDCYFRRRGLCALALERPCPTFRAAGSRLEPPVRPPLVPRRPLEVERAAAYAAA